MQTCRGTCPLDRMDEDRLLARSPLGYLLRVLPSLLQNMTMFYHQSPPVKYRIAIKDPSCSHHLLHTVDCHCREQPPNIQRPPSLRLHITIVSASHLPFIPSSLLAQHPPAWSASHRKYCWAVSTYSSLQTPIITSSMANHVVAR